MKTFIVLILTIVNGVIYGQETVHDELKRLFLDCDINLSPRLIVANSSLKFDWSVNKGVGNFNYGKTEGSDTHIFSTEVTKNSFFDVSIKKINLSISQIDEEISMGVFKIRETIVFYNPDDMISEYYKLIEKFEKFGYRIKTTVIQKENFETKLESTDILIDEGLRKSQLTILYSLPIEKKKNRDYNLVVMYTNDNRTLSK